MRKLVLTPYFASLVKEARTRQCLNIIEGAEYVGVSERVFKRWCVELGLSAPVRVGRPRVYATPADKQTARRQRYEENKHAAD